MIKYFFNSFNPRGCEEKQPYSQAAEGKTNAAATEASGTTSCKLQRPCQLQQRSCDAATTERIRSREERTGEQNATPF